MTEVVSAISITDDALSLRFPRGAFTDTYVRNLVASKRGSTAGDVQIRPWSEDRIGRWHIEKDRYDRIGCHVARAIRRMGRSPAGHGVVQRTARWWRIPLLDPPNAPVIISDSTIDGTGGWL